MYTISVPIKCSNLNELGRDKILTQLKRFDATRVFLSLGCYESDEEKRQKALSELKESCQFFKENGFEVGAWVWTFWLKNNTSFSNMRSINGTEISEFMCPLDSSFRAFAADYVADIAKCGVDIILFDDDFRYGFLSSSAACLCDKHISYISTLTNKELGIDEIRQNILNGGKNGIRDAFLKANRDALALFASDVRAAIDSVSKDVRVGICSCMSSWDLDGDVRELAYILAGGTKPLIRLIGAPYFASTTAWGNTLCDVIELERMESGWTLDESIEILAEGDTFPRPRIACPASYLEGFDTAMRVSGAVHGILKYGIDYYSCPDYETGYATMHEKNRYAYKAISSFFDNKASIGVRVYENPKKIENAVIPTVVNKEIDIQEIFFSKAARMLSHCSIPTVYEGSGLCGIAFDENARGLPSSALENGLIIDISAAEILRTLGVDTGIKRIGNEVRGGFERFLCDNNRAFSNGAIAYDIELSAKASILSLLEANDREIPFTYTYENGLGQRFFVININTRQGSDHLLKHYARSKQLSEVIPWLCGKSLPAYIHHPRLYVQCKQNDTALGIGLWNFFADPIYSPTVKLDKEYSQTKSFNCDVRLEGKKAYLSEIAPFGFAFIELSE